MTDYIKKLFAPFITIITIVIVAWGIMSIKRRNNSSKKEDEISTNILNNISNTKDAIDKANKHRSKAVKHAVIAKTIKNKTEKKIQESKDENFKDIIEQFNNLNS